MNNGNGFSLYSRPSQISKNSYHLDLLSSFPTISFFHLPEIVFWKCYFHIEIQSRLKKIFVKKVSWGVKTFKMIALKVLKKSSYLSSQIPSFKVKTSISFTNSFPRFSSGNVIGLFATSNYRLLNRKFCSKRSHWWLPSLLMDHSSCCSVVSSINQESVSLSLKQRLGKVNSCKSLCLGQKSPVSLWYERVEREMRRAFSASIVNMENFHTSSSTRWESGWSTGWCREELTL